MNKPPIFIIAILLLGSGNFLQAAYRRETAKFDEPLQVYSEKEAEGHIESKYYFSLLPRDVIRLLREFTDRPPNILGRRPSMGWTFEKDIDTAVQLQDKEALECAASLGYMQILGDTAYDKYGFSGGNSAVVRSFLARGGNPNFSVYYGPPKESFRWGTPFERCECYPYTNPWRACKGSKCEERRLYRSRVSEDAAKEAWDESWRRRTKLPLYAAAKNGHTHIVELLLKAGAEPNDSMPRGCFHHDHPITIAARYGHIKVVQMLLAANADPSLDEGNCLAAASSQGHLKIVELLLETGIDPNKTSALLNAVENKHITIARLLLAKGTKVSDYALSRAACSMDGEMIRLLLAAGGTLSYYEYDKLGWRAYYYFNYLTMLNWYAKGYRA